MEWGPIREGLTYTEATDSGATIIDHDALGVDIFDCWGPTTTVEKCQPIAERNWRSMRRKRVVPVDRAAGGDAQPRQNAARDRLARHGGLLTKARTDGQ
jgi:hypothetical protein